MASRVSPVSQQQFPKFQASNLKKTITDEARRLGFDGVQVNPDKFRDLLTYLQNFNGSTEQKFDFSVLSHCFRHGYIQMDGRSALDPDRLSGFKTSLLGFGKKEEDPMVTFLNPLMNQSSTSPAAKHVDFMVFQDKQTKEFILHVKENGQKFITLTLRSSVWMFNGSECSSLRIHEGKISLFNAGGHEIHFVRRRDSVDSVGSVGKAPKLGTGTIGRRAGTVFLPPAAAPAVERPPIIPLASTASPSSSPVVSRPVTPVTVVDEVTDLESVISPSHSVTAGFAMVGARDHSRIGDVYRVVEQSLSSQSPTISLNDWLTHHFRADSKHEGLEMTFASRKRTVTSIVRDGDAYVFHLHSSVARPETMTYTGGKFSWTSGDTSLTQLRNADILPMVSNPVSLSQFQQSLKDVQMGKAAIDGFAKKAMTNTAFMPYLEAISLKDSLFDPLEASVKGIVPEKGELRFELHQSDGSIKTFMLKIQDGQLRYYRTQEVKSGSDLTIVPLAEYKDQDSKEVLLKVLLVSISIQQHLTHEATLKAKEIAGNVTVIASRVPELDIAGRQHRASSSEAAQPAPPVVDATRLSPPPSKVSPSTSRDEDPASFGFGDDLDAQSAQAEPVVVSQSEVVVSQPEPALSAPPELVSVAPQPTLERRQSGSYGFDAQPVGSDSSRSSSPEPVVEAPLMEPAAAPPRFLSLKGPLRFGLDSASSADGAPVARPVAEASPLTPVEVPKLDLTRQAATQSVKGLLVYMYKFASEFANRTYVKDSTQSFQMLMSDSSINDLSVNEILKAVIKNTILKNLPGVFKDLPVNFGDMDAVNQLLILITSVEGNAVETTQLRSIFDKVSPILSFLKKPIEDTMVITTRLDTSSVISGVVTTQQTMTAYLGEILLKLSNCGFIDSDFIPSLIVECHRQALGNTSQNIYLDNVNIFKIIMDVFRSNYALSISEVKNLASAVRYIINDSTYRSEDIGRLLVTITPGRRVSLMPLSIAYAQKDLGNSYVFMALLPHLKAANCSLGFINQIWSNLQLYDVLSGSQDVQLTRINYDAQINAQRLNSVMQVEINKIRRSVMQSGMASVLSDMLHTPLLQVGSNTHLLYSLHQAFNSCCTYNIGEGPSPHNLVLIFSSWLLSNAVGFNRQLTPIEASANFLLFLHDSKFEGVNIPIVHERFVEALQQFDLSLNVPELIKLSTDMAGVLAAFEPDKYPDLIRFKPVEHDVEV